MIHCSVLNLRGNLLKQSYTMAELLMQYALANQKSVLDIAGRANTSQSPHFAVTGLDSVQFARVLPPTNEFHNLPPKSGGLVRLELYNEQFGHVVYIFEFELKHDCKFESFEKLNNYVKDIDAGFAGLLWSLQSNRLCISKNALMFARVLAKFYREPMRAFLGPVFLQVAEALFNNHQYDGSRLTQMAIVTSVDLLRLYKDQSSDFLDPLIGKLFLHSHIRHSTDRVVEAIMTNISPIFLLPKILNFIGNDDENIQFQTARWFRSILDKLDLVGFDHHQIGKLIQIVASKLDQLEVHKDCAELILHEVESKMGKSNFGRICVEVLPPESVEIVLEATLKCARKFEEAAEAELKLKESEQTFTLQL